MASTSARNVTAEAAAEAFMLSLIHIYTANVEDIKKANDMGVICGVTTNPSLIGKRMLCHLLDYLVRDGRNIGTCKCAVCYMDRVTDGCCNDPVSYTHLDVYKRQVINNNIHHGMASGQLSLIPKDHYCFHPVL